MLCRDVLGKSAVKHMITVRCFSDNKPLFSVSSVSPCSLQMSNYKRTTFEEDDVADIPADGVLSPDSAEVSGGYCQIIVMGQKMAYCSLTVSPQCISQSQPKLLSLLTFDICKPTMSTLGINF